MDQNGGFTVPDEFERQLILERQREGIQIAKREGRYKGRKAKAVDEELFSLYYDKYTKRKINKVQFADALKVSRPTLDKILKERGLGN